MDEVIVIGKYNRQYSRIRVLLKALEIQGMRIKEFNFVGHLLIQHIHFLLKMPQIIRYALRSRFILVPYPGWNSIIMAKTISKLSGKKILFDAFISIYNTRVEDVKTTERNSYRAYLYWFLDKFACSLADIVILDTNQHIRYFKKVFSLHRSKFMRVFVGVDVSPERKRILRMKTKKIPILFFYGSYSPLQGIPYIIKSANILRKQKIPFNLVLIGEGGEYQAVRQLIQDLDLNDCVSQQPPTSYSKLLDYINDADICLGIFGETTKARMVIPNKVYDYGIMNKVMITGRSRAIQELLQEGEDFVGCPFADEVLLAATIKKTLEDFPNFRRKLNPQKTIQNFASPESIGSQLMKDLENVGI